MPMFRCSELSRAPAYGSGGRHSPLNILLENKILLSVEQKML